jgi:hypothetical protein
MHDLAVQRIPEINKKAMAMISRWHALVNAIAHETIYATVNIIFSCPRCRNRYIQTVEAWGPPTINVYTFYCPACRNLWKVEIRFKGMAVPMLLPEVPE